jgi:predicted MFS family arabinose efflux permease
VLLPRLRLRVTVDGIVSLAIVVFAAMTFLAGRAEKFEWLSLILFLSGAAWIAILACLNIAAQTMAPSGMRARSLSIYLLVLQGGMALGSAAWGALAVRTGISAALLYSSIALLCGLVTVRSYPLVSRELRSVPLAVGQ